MPVQQGVVLTQARVRVPSAFGLFVVHTLAGAAGAAIMVGMAEAMKRSTRLSPELRGALTVGTGLIGGALVGRSSPRLGAGLSIGGMAASGPAFVEAIETSSAIRDAAPVLEQRPEPVTSNPPSAGVVGPGLVLPQVSLGNTQQNAFRSPTKPFAR